MSLCMLLALAAAIAGPVQTETIGYNDIQAITQMKAFTISEKAAARFQSQLNIGNGCHLYPAVNAQGQTSRGRKPSWWPSFGCMGVFKTSQVYVRSGWHNNLWAIKYAWYSPKDSPQSDQGHRHDWEKIVVWLENPAPEYPKLLAISTSSGNGEYLKYSPPDEKFIAGNAPLVKYESADEKEHTLTLNNRGGGVQQRVMWSQLPEAARIALNETSFDPAIVPFKDASLAVLVNPVGLYACAGLTPSMTLST